MHNYLFLTRLFSGKQALSAMVLSRVLSDNSAIKEVIILAVAGLPSDLQQLPALN